MTLGISILGLLLSCSQAAIHGADDLQLSSNVQDQRLKEIALSVAAKIPAEALSSQYSFEYENLRSKKGFCAHERFSDLPSLATCTGVLIAPDKILTTFHCMRTEDECAKARWTFAFRTENLPSQNTDLNPAETYNCKKIVASNTHLLTYQDYTVIELDRPVTGRTPVAYRQQGQVSAQDRLAIIGYPYGLPSITAINGRVLKNDQPHVFSTDLDAFAGNSGSPVINMKTYEMEGIFIRGGTDTDMDWKAEPLCKVWLRCGNKNQCQTEDVTRITSIPLKKILVP